MLMAGLVSRSKHANRTLHSISSLPSLPFSTTTHLDLNQKKDWTKNAAEDVMNERIEEKEEVMRMKDCAGCNKTLML